jgi:GT2 family glycosyltransferase
MPVWNNKVITKDCVDSILKNTGTDYTLIIIDNASDEETRHYLESIKKEKGLHIQVIRNNSNLGFVKAVNQGIRHSKAPFICLINNDTIATRGWLEGMIKAAQSDTGIGIVNPSSNNLGQKPTDGEPLERYAQHIASDPFICVEIGAAIGFCMLIKREVIERIGLFDEIYGMGNFEDTDFSKRAVKEGYKCVRACRSYVYHREGSSFRKMGTFEDDFRRNREIFEFRWGKPRRIAYVVDSYDENTLRSLTSESIKLARDGNWVFCFSRQKIPLPAHSNIIPVELGNKRFYLNAVFMILKKKKRFSEIFVGNENLGRFLERLSFLHKASVRYY